MAAWPSRGKHFPSRPLWDGCQRCAHGGDKGPGAGEGAGRGSTKRPGGSRCTGWHFPKEAPQVRCTVASPLGHKQWTTASLLSSRWCCWPLETAAEAHLRLWPPQPGPPLSLPPPRPLWFWFGLQVALPCFRDKGSSHGNDSGDWHGITSLFLINCNPEAPSFSPPLPGSRALWRGVNGAPGTGSVCGKASAQLAVCSISPEAQIPAG